MTYLTSIPAYLWRNTLRRWLENPASPATKFLVPFLFGLLALFILGILKGVELELKAQLSRADLRSITLSEFVRSEEAESRYHSAMEHPTPWAKWCETSDLFLQAPLTANSRFFSQMPVLGYVDEPSFIDLPEPEPGQPRTALILSSRELPPTITSTQDYIEIAGSFRVPANLAEMPPQFSRVFQTQGIAMIPAEMLEPTLTQAHTRFQILTPYEDVPTSRLEKMIRTYAEVENRDFRLFSAEEVLEQLEQITRRQEHARIFLGFGIATILSLILGSLSLLEFRQELYLFALLRSFGVKSSVLIKHYIFETSLITALGGLAALLFNHTLTPWILNMQSSATELSIPISTDALSGSDFSILLIAIAAGVILSTLPLVFGLRKPAGLLLP